MFSYTTKILDSVSFDFSLFVKELKKAIKMLLPYEIEQLADWLQTYTVQKPELKQCLIYIER